MNSRLLTPSQELYDFYRMGISKTKGPNTDCKIVGLLF